MATQTIGYYAPLFAGGPGLSPLQQGYLPAQGASWREGDILQFITTGSITNPPAAGVGTLAGVAGPIAYGQTGTPITITNSTSAGAPAQTYYIRVTYTGASTAESDPSDEFVFSSPAGKVPAIATTDTGAPALATGTNVYIGIYPGTEALQNASPQAFSSHVSTVTAANPLTNSAGINESVTNPANGLIGIANTDFDATYFDGTGGSNLIGNRSRFGASNSVMPLTPTDAPLLFVTKLQSGDWEFSLKQSTSWSENLVGTSVGLVYDTASGFWIVDPAGSNKVATIKRLAVGVPFQVAGIPVTGRALDLGVRVIVSFTAADLS